jgi:hypothetical protein
MVTVELKASLSGGVGALNFGSNSVGYQRFVVLYDLDYRDSALKDLFCLPNPVSEVGWETVTLVAFGPSISKITKFGSKAVC